MPTYTWHTTLQSAAMSSADVNDMLVLHGSTITYPGTMTNYFATSGSVYTDYIQSAIPLPSSSSTAASTISAYAQPFTLALPNTVTLVQVPISYQQFASLGTNYTYPCDMTVSIQGTDGSGFPNGTVYTSAKIPASVIAAVSSSSWPEPMSMLPSQWSATQFSSMPVSSASTTTSVAYLNITTATTIQVSSVSGFPTSGGTLYIHWSGNYANLSYTGVTSSFGVYTFTGVTWLNGGSGSTSVPAGSSVSFSPSSQFAYVPAGDYVLAINCFSAGHTNTPYIAPYAGSGTLGQWSAAPDLPEYNCSVAYAPSSETFFAIGPSGAVYQASFDSTTGIVGTWQTTQLTDSTGAVFALPHFNVVTTDLPAVVAIGTIDSTDYVFLTGGKTNSVGAVNSYYFSVDSTGTVGNVYQVSAYIPVTCWQGTGVHSFTYNNHLFIRNSTLSNVQVFSIPYWIDGSGTFNVGTQWSFIGKSDTGTVIWGISNDNLVTDSDIIGLTPNGYGSSDASTFWPTLGGVNIIGSAGVVFTNDDGSTSAICKVGYSASAYPVVWINVPLYYSFGAGTYQLVLSTSVPQKTNYGVNIATTYGGTYTNYAYKDSLGWHRSGAGQIIPFSTFANDGHLPAAWIDDSGSRWGYVSYDYPNHLLISAIEVSYDAANSVSTAAACALSYDGLGGQNGTEPTLTSITELI